MKKILLLLSLGVCCLQSINVSAAQIPYAGITFGPANSSDDSEYESSTAGYLFMGLQFESYLTLEMGIQNIKFTRYAGDKTSESLNFLLFSAMGHLPLGDSSLFLRGGLGTYSYYRDDGTPDDKVVPLYGLGFDFAITPYTSIRFEWIRYEAVQLNSTEFDIDTTTFGVYFYF